MAVTFLTNEDKQELSDKIIRWEEPMSETVLIPETVATYNEEYECPAVHTNIDLIAGDTYKIVIEGKEYIREAFDCGVLAGDPSYTGIIMIGNHSSLSYELEDTGEPFALFRDHNGIGYPSDLLVMSYWVGDGNDREYLNQVTISISKFEHNKIHESNLPENKIDSITASVGQTIIVKEIDANGKPTKWESADYQPRTHWKSDAVVIPETTLVVEEGTAVMETDFNYVVGKEYKVKFNGVEYLCTAIERGPELGAEVSVAAIGNFDALMGTGDNGIPFFSLFEGVLAFLVLDGSESVTLSIAEVVYNQIPVQYVTNALPYYIDVVCETSQMATTPDVYTCADTVENVKKIYDSGRELRVRITTVGDNPLHYIQILNLFYFSRPFFSLGFACSKIVGSAGNQLVYLNPKEDGTFEVTKSLGD